MTPRRGGASRNRTAGAVLTLFCTVAYLAAMVLGTDPSLGLTSSSTAARPTTRSANPLAGHPWGVYRGDADQAWEPYLAASGTDRALLGKIVDQPKAAWFGRWIPNSSIEDKVSKYLAATTGGDPDVLAQLTLFRMDPWEDAACSTLPSAAQQASYRDWIDKVATAIGSTRTAVILQPDGPFALCAPHHSKLPSHLIAYAAQRLSALANTSVYIDAGAEDWDRGNPATAVRILMSAGIRYVRGFALDSTHYDSTASEVEFGTRVVAALSRRGVGGRHFVVNTAENGRPFTGSWWSQHHTGTSFDNAGVCLTRHQSHCVTLGIPPTTDVDDPAWHLSTADERRARHHVDAYLWFGRPWLDDQAAPFDLVRALLLATTTPY